jgi:hypothetical protein
MSTKRYKLINPAMAAEKGEKLACAFFASPQGCRNGANCKFAHDNVTERAPQPQHQHQQHQHQQQQQQRSSGTSHGRKRPSVEDVGSVVSSESDSDNDRIMNRKAPRSMALSSVSAKAVAANSNSHNQNNQKQNNNKKALPASNPKPKAHKAQQTPQPVEQQQPHEQLQPRNKKAKTATFVATTAAAPKERYSQPTSKTPTPGPVATTAVSNAPLASAYTSMESGMAVVPASLVNNNVHRQHQQQQREQDEENDNYNNNYNDEEEEVSEESDASLPPSSSSAPPSHRSRSAPRVEAHKPVTPQVQVQVQQVQVQQVQVHPLLASLNLPIAPYVPHSSTKQQESNSSSNSSNTKSPQVTPHKQQRKVADERIDMDSDDDDDDVVDMGRPVLPLPTAQVAQRWVPAIVQGRMHPRYETHFDFAKYKVQCETLGICSSSAWIRAKPYGDWCVDLPQIIAVDCEMCETQDPVTGHHDPRALCRVSFVDCVTNDVLLDTLVKPAWPVVNYRTHINGINEDDLKHVQFTLRHAQAFFLSMCSAETVLVGHAVHNDLAAMHIEHFVCADSACLYRDPEESDRCVALKDVALTVLKHSMPVTHDSVGDAQTAQHCVEYYLDHDGKVPAIPRSSVTARERYASQLFLHRIPNTGWGADTIVKLFTKHTHVVPTQVDEIDFTSGGGAHGKTHVTFKSGRHAELAFDCLEGTAMREASGREQKKFYTKDGILWIRKMLFDKKADEFAVTVQSP